MPNVENRLRRVEAQQAATEREPIVVRWRIIDPPPRDEAGKIIGPSIVHDDVYVWREVRS